MPRYTVCSFAIGEEDTVNDPLLHGQTPAEYFKDLVDSALVRQHLHANELTACYLVNLLCGFVRPDRASGFGDDDLPLAFRLGRALESGGLEQRARLRSLGDFSLFMSGFFSDSFRRRSVDVDYYVSMGEYAYGSLSRRDEDAFGDVFAELAAQVRGVHRRAVGRQRANGPGGARATSCGSTRNGCGPAARATASAWWTGASFPTRSIGSRFIQ